MPLHFGPPKIGSRGHSAAAIQPLILAAEMGGDLAPVVQAISHSFGFEVFAHGVMLSIRLEAESQSICLARIRLSGFKFTIGVPMF